MSTWHEKMAEAVRQRQHAVNGILRWQEKQKVAEALIEELTAKHPANDQLPSVTNEGTKDEAALLSGDLRPVFGVTEAPQN